MTRNSSHPKGTVKSPPAFATSTRKRSDEIPEKFSEEVRISKMPLLEIHEEKIREFGAAFVNVALAIDEVASKKLFRLRGYRRIEDYLAGEWGMSRAHGDRFRKAASIINDIRLINRALPPKASLPIPRTQIAYRELHSVLPKDGKRKEVLKAILEKAREKALDELKGHPKQPDTVIDIDVEHIREAIVVEKPEVATAHSRKDVFAMSRRNLEAMITRLMPVLDLKRTEEKRIFDDSKDILRRLLALSD